MSFGNVVAVCSVLLRKNRIPCDIKGFADDLSLIATLESPSSNGKGGFDADTLREITQKSLNSINEWCKENGLRISALQTNSVMFTWKRKWKFSVPLKIDNDIIEMKSSTKFLDVTLDSKLTWNEHITNQEGQRHPDAMQESCWSYLGVHPKDHEMDLHSRC